MVSWPWNLRYHLALLLLEEYNENIAVCQKILCKAWTVIWSDKSKLKREEIMRGRRKALKDDVVQYTIKYGEGNVIEWNNFTKNRIRDPVKMDVRISGLSTLNILEQS